ncbi:MAG: hypothetical protein J6332_04695 [Abditibacteriota bacterium]|nr:hypothetical protein [Abditibacteriota bacterium]
MTIRRFTSYVLAGTMFLSTCSSVLSAAASVRLLAPAESTVATGGSMEVSVGFNTGDEKVKVTKLELWVDGEFALRRTLNNAASHGVTSFLWNTSKAGKGAHNLVVKVFAGSKLISEVSGIGNVGDIVPARDGVDTKAPVVAFKNLKAGEILSGTKKIELAANDDSGEPPLVSLLVDDTLKLLKNVPPYNYALDTTTYKDGSHNISTYAYDNSGNMSDTVSLGVTFKNGLTEPTVTTMSVTNKETKSALRDALSGKQDRVATIPIPKTPAQLTAARTSQPAVNVPSSIAPAASLRTSETAGTPMTAVSAPIAAPNMTGVSSPATSAPAGVIRGSENSGAVSGPAAALPVSPGIAGVSGVPSAVTVPVVRGSQTFGESASRAAEPSMPVNVSSANGVASSLRGNIRTGNSGMASSGLTAAEPAMPVSISSASGVTNALVGNVRTGSSDFAAAGVSAPAEPSLPVSVSSVSDISAATQALIRMNESELAASGAASSVPSEPINIEKPVLIAKADLTGELRHTESVEVPVNDSLSAVEPEEVKPAEAASPVKIAMAPTVKDNTPQGQSSYSTLPLTQKSTKAIIKKSKAVTSKKIRARGFFEDMGGVLLWDNDTKTVTVITDSMKMEMVIGSATAKVNGKEMKLSSAPYIVNGRTVIDSDTYDLALAFLSAQKLASK